MPAGVGDYAQVELNGYFDGSGVASGGYCVLCDGWWTFSLVASERTLIKDMVLFDDNLVMLAPPAINSGIYGYRAGQELKDKSDFIEYIANDPGPTPPSPPPAPSDCPDWVNSGWSYIEDDFDGGVYDSYWNSDFTSNNSLNQYPAGSYEYTAVRGSNGEDQLTPVGTYLENDFDLIMGVRCYDTNTGSNKSVHLTCKDSSNNDIIDVSYVGNADDITLAAVDSNEANYQVRQDVSQAFSANMDVFLRIKKEGDTYTAYYKTDWEDSWTQFSYSVTISGGASPVYLVVDGADLHGVGMFRFQSEDADFPYSC